MNINEWPWKKSQAKKTRFKQLYCSVGKDLSLWKTLGLGSRFKLWYTPDIECFISCDLNAQSHWKGSIQNSWYKLYLNAHEVSQLSEEWCENRIVQTVVELSFILFLILYEAKFHGLFSLFFLSLWIWFFFSENNIRLALFNAGWCLFQRLCWKHLFPFVGSYIVYNILSANVFIHLTLL